MKTKFDKKWFMPIRQTQQANFNMICFPYGGGSAASFWHWNTFAINANIWALKLPGRDDRLHEEPIKDAGKLVANVFNALPYIDQTPFILYGHSMGAALAFLLILELEKNQRSLPRLLIVSGREPPHFTHPNPITGLDDEDLIMYVKSLGGIKKNFPNNEIFLRNYVKKIRADYALNGSIIKQTPCPLSVYITIINGSEDPLIDQTVLPQWQYFSKYPVDNIVLKGDHFFLEKNFILFKKEIERKCNTIKFNKEQG